MVDLSGVRVVTNPSREQLIDYRTNREACLSWLLTMGKDPKRADGYALETVKARGYRSLPDSTSIAEQPFFKTTSTTRISTAPAQSGVVP